jgi:alpha-1,2-mannosyltransferase
MVLIRGNHVDFDVYAAAGRRFLQGADPYAVAGELPFTYPPFALLLAAGFAAAPWLFLAALGALTVVVPWATTRAVVGRAGAGPLVGTVLCGAAIVAEPVLRGLHLGQVNGLVLGLVVADFCLMPPRWRGYLTGIAAGIKLTPLVFGLVLLVRADWGALLRLGGTFLGTVAVGGLLVPDGLAVWARLLSPRRVGDPAFIDNQSLRGLLDRAAGGPAPTWLWLLCVGAVLGVGVAVLWRSRRQPVIGSVLLCSLVGVLVSPISWSHHWLLLVPTIAWVALSSRTPSRARIRSAAHGVVVTVGIAVALLGPHWWLPRAQWESGPVTLGGQLLASSMTLVGGATLVVALVASLAMSQPSRRMIPSSTTVPASDCG